MGRASQEAGPAKQYASNRSSFPKPQVQPWIHLTWVNVESPHAFRASRIWFRSCSASCLSCSSSLMAPGPWGGVGGGWGPRDGGWGRQLLAAGPRPGGCRADVRPKVAGKKGGKAGLKRGRKG